MSTEAGAHLVRACHASDWASGGGDGYTGQTGAPSAHAKTLEMAVRSRGGHPETLLGRLAGRR